MSPPTPLSPGGGVGGVPPGERFPLTVEVRVCVLTLAGAVCVAITNHHQAARLQDARSLICLLANTIWATRSLGMKMYSQQAVYGHSPSTQMQPLSDTDKEAVNGSCRRETALQRGSVLGGWWMMAWVSNRARPCDCCIILKPESYTNAI